VNSAFLLNARLLRPRRNSTLPTKRPLARLNLLTETVQGDRYPLSPGIQTVRGILAKFGPMAPLPRPPAGPRTPS
jgi:hypothetical protein